jgi:hypothetical protein
MKRAFSLVLPTFAVVAALYVLPGMVRADEKKDRGKSSGLIAKEIMHLQLHKIYVADFLDGSGARTDKGCYFASIFSTNLKDQARGFNVVNRIDGQKLLDNAGIAAGDLQKPEALSKMSAASGADGVLLGTLILRKDQAVLDLFLRDATTNRELYHTVYRETLAPGFNGYFPPVTDPTGRLFYFAGLDGLSQPNCIHCPNPMYTDPGRSSKIQGTVVL